MRYIYIIFMVAALTAAGCQHQPKLSRKNEPVRIPSADSGKILDPGRLSQGGKLLIVPFSPGVNVAATEQLEGVALRVVKGTGEGLAQKNSNLQVLLNDTAANAELVIKGRVVSMLEPKGMKNKLFKNGRRVLAVKGELMDLRTNKAIAFFSFAQTAASAQESFEDLGVKIGAEIANFLAQQSG